MRKIVFLPLLAAAVIVATAYLLLFEGADGDALNDEPVIAAEARWERNLRIMNERRGFANSIGLDELLEDFDYLMRVLDENFPFFDVEYRVQGLDIREHGRQFRSLLEGTGSLNLNTFQLLLQRYFFAPVGSGHLGVQDRLRYLSWHYFALAEADSDMPVLERLAMAAILEQIAASPKTGYFFGEFDKYDLLDAGARWSNRFEDPGNISAGIIEYGRIAYIRINRMLSVLGADIEMLDIFYSQIADYEHLIIDIRGNGGGGVYMFHELITSPHLDAPLKYVSVAFYKGGGHNLRFLNRLFGEYGGGRPSHFYGNTFTVGSGRVVGDCGAVLVLCTRYLAGRDLDAFTYYRLSTNVINPSEPGGLRSEFRGQKWLLIDGGTASGSEIIANLFKQKDLAILVGERGGGYFVDFGLFANYVPLPNSGAVVRFDIGYPVCHFTGRSLEDGTPPHYFNFAGMDALETVLVLINSGVH